MATEARTDFETSFEDVNYVDIGLTIVDQTGGKFRVDGGRPPKTSTARETGVLVRYGIIDTIHGKLSSTDSSYCSIVVFDFQFDLIKQSRRIQQVNIDVVVSDPGCEIRDTAPSDRVSINRHTQDVEDTLSGGGKLGLEYAGADAHAKRTTKMEKVGYATVKGWPAHLPRARERTGEPCNAARWVVLENPVAKDGVPARLRAAVLVVRGDEEKFQLEIQFDIKADWRSQLEEMFGATPVNTPVDINPKDPSTKRVVKEYEINSLGLIDLQGIHRVSYGSFVEKTFSSA